MSKFLLGLVGAVFMMGVASIPAQASKVKVAEFGSLVVFGNDESKLFSQNGIDKAKAALAAVPFDHGLNVTVDTYAEPPAAKKAAALAVKGDKEKWHKFMHDWAVERAQGDKAKGIYIIICHKPGGVAVVADKAIRERGFTKEKEQHVLDLLLKSFIKAGSEKDAAKQLEIHNDGLKAAMDYIAAELKNSVAATTENGHVGTAPHNANHENGGSFMSKYGGLICLGIVGIVIVLVVIGVIRAMTSGGGGMGGGGMGGGGGGGGFMSSMFGGVLGAMGGMWLYNNLFGHGSSLGGSDSYSGNNYGDSGGYGGGGTETGAGDFSGDDGASGGFDDGGSGGGDFGGGGGDIGGGGGDF